MQLWCLLLLLSPPPVQRLRAFSDWSFLNFWECALSQFRRVEWRQKVQCLRVENVCSMSCSTLSCTALLSQPIVYLCYPFLSFLVLVCLGLSC